MSGIAGILRLDGLQIDGLDKIRMADALKHRGPLISEGIEQGVLMAFGSIMHVNESDRLYATVDADVFVHTSPKISYTTAFREKKTTWLTDFNADFALALWDDHEKMLVLARDPLGVKPMYYVHQPGRFVAFASEIKALLAIQDVIVKPNERKFREYLTWTTTYLPYSAETFYEDIYSVLPGHYVQIDSDGVKVFPYWTVDADRFRGLTKAEDYSTLFHDYFTVAVDRRMRGKKKVGAHLSGGLDSSSVSCVAQSLLVKQKRQALHTFNIDTRLPSTDESEYVHAVVNQWNPTHHTVNPLDDVLESVLTINRYFDRPDHFIIPSSFHLSVSLAAQQIGCDTLLTGHDGDSVITTGFDWFDELLDAGDWKTLAHACRQYVDLRPSPSDTATKVRWGNDRFEQYALNILSSNLKKRLREQPVSQFWTTFWQQQQIFKLSSAAMITYAARRVKQRLMNRTQIDSALSEEFKRRVPHHPPLSTESLASALSEGRRVPVKQILNTTNVICNEQLNHIGAYYGHSYSFPFFDKDVIELGLATPLSICFDNGRGRGLIRNGLREVLPPTVLDRLTKANFVEYGTLSAQQLYRAAYAQFASPGHPIWGVVDRAIFSRIVTIVFNDKLPATRKTRYNWLLSRIIYLALWLGALRS
jgi:asparagine synthase (glutamine-hydrolysing)